MDTGKLKIKGMLDLSTNDAAFVLPKGGVLDRPTSPMTGMLRYNTDLSRIETWNGVVWTDLVDDARRISELPAAEPLTGAELVPVAQGANTVQTTLDAISNLAATVLSFATRSELVAHVTANGALPNALYNVGGILFVGVAGPTAIVDLPGLIPLGPDVSPEHFGANDRAALAAADAYVQTTPGTRLLLRGDVTLSSALPLRCRSITGKGKIIVPSTFSGVAGSFVVSVGENASSINQGWLEVDVWIDGTAYFGLATGTWDPASGAFPVATAAGQSWKVVADGSFAGQDFVAEQLIRSLVANPSTTTFANNWVTIPAEIAAMRVSGPALPHGKINLNILGCDVGLHTRGNVERSRMEVGATRCHIAVLSTSFVATSTTSSPDNNSYRIRTSSCGQYYVARGSILEDVALDCQSQLVNYLRYPVDIRTQRVITLSGCMRSAQHGAVYINQLEDKRNTGVVFSNLQLTSPGSDELDEETGETVVPSVRCDYTGFLAGRIISTSPSAGIEVRRCLGADLHINVESQRGGTYVLKLGDTATSGTVSRSRFTLTAVRHESVEDVTLRMLDLQRATFSHITVMADPRPIDCALCEGSLLEVNARYITTNTAINGSNEAGLLVRFIGSASQAEFDAYTTSALGMSGQTNNGRRAPIIFTGRGSESGWQSAAVGNLDISGNSYTEGVATLNGTGSAVSFNIPHGMGIGVVPTNATLTPASSVAASIPHWISAIGNTAIQVTFASAPPSGTGNIVFHWRASI